MKKLIPLLVLTLATIAPMVHADDEVTPLQLKVMQTRKFIKPSLEVSKAAVEDGESLGATRCGNFFAIAHQRSNNSKNRPSGEVTCMFTPKFSMLSIDNDSIRRVTYEITPNQDDTETTVRLKIFTGWKDTKQVTDPEEYAKRFKSMGDLIFIEAIPLTPAVQN